MTEWILPGILITFALVLLPVYICLLSNAFYIGKMSALKKYFNIEKEDDK